MIRLLVCVAVAVGTAWWGGAEAVDLPEPMAAAGFEYSTRSLDQPRPNRVHVLRVDLTTGQAEPAVALGDDPDGDGPAEAALTDPRVLAGSERVVAFVNTNPWSAMPDDEEMKKRGWYEGQPVDIIGLATMDGVERSPSAGLVDVWLDAQGRVRLGTVPEDAAVVEGVGGFAQIVDDGEVSVGEDEPLHPRTGIGVDREGRVLWLVVVDGRQPGFSEGMTVHELARLMKDLGCWDAANLDGGGSSVMGLAGVDGRLEVVNSPSGRMLPDILTPRLRPVPSILTVRAQPGSPLAAWLEGE